MKILFLGHGRSGKDTAIEYLAKITGLRNAGTTSIYLRKYVAKEFGVSEEQAYAERHQNREEWKRIGDEIRGGDPGKLLREALEVGDLTGGLRDIAEVVTAKQEKLVDLIVWVENRRVPVDPTVTFSEKECDVVIQNNWSLEDFYERLDRFAAFAGLISNEERFKRSMDVASAEVAKWPAWKQNILKDSLSPTVPVARTPIYSEDTGW